MCLTGLCDIQKYADLDTIISKILRILLVTYQLVICAVHKLDPFYSLLPATDNDLSVLRDGDHLLEFCSGTVQVRRVDIINSVTGFDEAVEAFGYIS